jgi:type VI secretion system protein ImpA
LWNRFMQEIDTGIDWKSPVSEDLPAGPDMQYTAKFAELEAAAAGTPEQQYGKVLIPAKLPEWQQVFELAAKLSEQTRDLRVVLLMSRALTRLHGLPGLLKGLEALDDLLQQKWEYVHPQIIVDGVNDPLIRYGVLSEFADPEGLVGDVRQTIALHTPLGMFTVRDLERVAEQGAVELNGIAINREKIDDMVRDKRQTTEATALGVPSRLIELLNGLLRNVQERSGPDFTPDLTNLKRPLERISSVLGSGAPAAPVPLPTEADPSAPVDSSTSVGAVALGALNSRADVVRAMDAICAYLERHEPTNPVPLLIRRARRLMAMSFLEIVKDITPESLNQVLHITGTDENGPA